MKKTVFALAAMSAAVVFAQQQMRMPMPGQGPNGEQLTPEQRAERARKFKLMRYKSTGGFYVKPGSQNGKIVYVNCQKSVPVEWIKESVSNFIAQTKFAIEVKDGAFSLPDPKIEGTVSLFVIDDEKMPPILHAPESRWTMVNVAPLKKGRGEKEAFLHARVEKELTRGFCLLAGTQTSNYPNSLLNTIAKTEDLDQHMDWRLPVDILARFKPYLSGFGVTPAEEVSYKRACQEGWAGQPTNEFQKAIWDKVHEVPTKPIKIEFDPKRDAGK